MPISGGIIGYPQSVMAGLDPAIQTQRQTAAWLMNWMAGSSPAMTSGGSFAGPSVVE